MITVIKTVTLTVKIKKPMTFWTRFQNIAETNKIAIKYYSFLAILIYKSIVFYVLQCLSK